ncbi:MAG: WecB/TagA/CpsF family glycosyltransferase [Acidobacteriota bacterium]|nr:WecB/TagA/CpsF family glycosyltransferase [Acidobacteriota bacterium]
MTAVCPVPAKQDVLGVRISATSYNEVAATCAAWIASKEPHDPAHYICVTSVHGVMEARRDLGIRSILNRADIATPDGMPLVWALRSFGLPEQQRVYGPTLMLALCEQAMRLGHRVFLYGGRPETLDALRTNLLTRFPGLILAGSYSPPFRELNDNEESEVRRMIRDAAPDLLFVGISTPKQERWMASHQDAFAGVVMVGVGAAFDFHAGRVKQAPAWMQRNGLEWFFRLTCEPVRLWKRYVLLTPRFLPLWAMQKVSIAMRHIACGRNEAGA